MLGYTYFSKTTPIIMMSGPKKFLMSILTLVYYVELEMLISFKIKNK
jgi:hypothetical protein